MPNFGEPFGETFAACMLSAPSRGRFVALASCSAPVRFIAFACCCCCTAVGGGRGFATPRLPPFGHCFAAFVLISTSCFDCADSPPFG